MMEVFAEQLRAGDRLRWRGEMLGVRESWAFPPKDGEGVMRLAVVTDRPEPRHPALPEHQPFFTLLLDPMAVVVAEAGDVTE